MIEKPTVTDQEILADVPHGETGVEIIPRYSDDISHPNCLVVAPFRKTEHGPTIMATVEHYFENSEPGGFPWTILPVTSEPLTLKAAMETALSFAEHNNIPVIFVNQDGFSTAAEKQQTDTKAIRTGTPTPR
jgi:hypothetical protein